MAKPDPRGRFDQKKAEPTHQQDQEEEKDGGQKDANESDKQNAEQNALGNAALQNQAISAAPGEPNSGDGGGGGLSQRRADLAAEVAFGGDGDADDLPLTLEDLVRSWNPGIEKSKDRASWLEPMPEDELADEDPEWLAAVDQRSPVPGASLFTLDSQLQPSAAVLRGGVLDWCAEATRWSSPDLLDRAIAHTIVPGAPILQDHDGRLVIARTRMTAIASLLVQRGPGLQSAGAADLALATFCIELAGHGRHAEMVRIDPGVEGKQMPKSTVVFDRAFQSPPASVVTVALQASARPHLERIMGRLFDMEDPHVYLPSLTVAEPVPTEDDPLGLDALFDELLGGGMKSEEPLYYSAIQAAERLAAATARTRIHAAALAVCIASVSRQWSSGPPMDNLDRALQNVDQASDKSLRLLVEIARAAQKQNVPPKGLKAGLTRACRGLRKVHVLTLELFAEVVGGVLPGSPAGHALPQPTSDPLESAWADGSPAHAHAWLADLPSTPTNQAALLVTRMTTEDPGLLAGPLLDVRNRLDDERLRHVLGIYGAAGLARSGDWAGSAAIGQELMTAGLQRGNGVLFATGAMTDLDAHAHLGTPGWQDRWVSAGAAAKQLGAPAALTCLARYRRPLTGS